MHKHGLCAFQDKRKSKARLLRSSAGGQRKDRSSATSGSSLRGYRKEQSRSSSAGSGAVRFKAVASRLWQASMSVELVIQRVSGAKHMRR